MPRISESLRPNRQTGEYVAEMRFGAGEHSSASPIDIDILECADGENEFLEFDQGTFKNRPAFDLIATATNGGQINGFVELIKTDGTVSLLVDAGGTVYDWDGESTFSSVGTVPTNARIRGNRFSTDTINDQVIVTDLKKSCPVKTWDGTTFSNLTTNLGGEFRAAYCRVDKERALYGNVQTTSDTPHLLVASERAAIGTLTVTNRPSSSLSAGDPWFLPTPDLRPINGLETAFGAFLVSTQAQGTGNLYKLTGSDATDYAIDTLYENSGALGEEAIIHTGNDIHWGKNGRIESLAGVQNFGDVETDDVSRWISNKIEKVKGWRVKYNSRTRRAYWWPDDGNEVWVFNNFMYDPLRAAVRIARPDIPQGVSPWTRFTTDYGNSDFRVTAAEVLKDPGDKLDYLYFGMSDGTIFRMEGAGLQDAGTTDVVTYRESGLFDAPGDAEVYDVFVTVVYRKTFSATLNVTLEFQGSGLSDQSFTVAFTAFDNVPVFGGSYYFGGSFYFGTLFAGRLQRQTVSAAGRSGAFQIKASVTGADFDIHKIIVRFKPARKT